MSALQIVTARIYKPYIPYDSPTYEQANYYIYYKHTLDSGEVDYLLDKVTLQNLPDSVLSYIVSTGVTRYLGLTKLCLSSSHIRDDTDSARKILQDLDGIEQCIHPYGTTHSLDMFDYIHDLADKEEQDTWHYTI